MDGYIKKSEAVDMIVKYPYDIAGKTATAIKMIEDLPSADVVPKSHYECLLSLNRRLEKEMGRKEQKIQELIKQIDSVEVDTALEVASEIFAEIYERLLLSFPAQSFIDAPCTTHDRLFNMVAELKKKYTEGEDKPASEEKHFSPEDVRNMTPQEVREKYTAIRKSMEMW